MDAKADRNPKYLRELRITRDRFPDLHERPVSDISHRDLEPLLTTILPSGRNAVMRYLRAVFNYGIKREYLTNNPISRLDFVERPRREVVTIPKASGRHAQPCFREQLRPTIRKQNQPPLRGDWLYRGADCQCAHHTMSELNDIEYPDETLGSILAREARVKGNRLIAEEREKFF